MLIKYQNVYPRMNGVYLNYGTQPVPPTPSSYSGFTYGTTGELKMTIDPADGVSKYLTASYYQVEGGDWSGRYTTNPVGLSDCLGIYAPSAGVYSLVWDNWRTYAGSNSIRYRSDGSLTTASLTSIKSMDFWGKQKYNAENPWWEGGYDFRGKNIIEIPQSPENLHNGENLSSFSGFFANNRSLTSNLIPFITAMYAACPNLQYTSACFSGCTAAGDYAQALAQYPAWF